MKYIKSYKHINENVYLYSAINSHNLNYDDLIKYGVKINSNFYKWNNNSKFIGIYYHGSKSNFTEFKIEKDGEHSHAYGIYFTDSPSHASTYTPFEELDDEYDLSKLDKLDINKSKYLYPCFLRVNNPFIMMKNNRINIDEWIKLDSELKSKPIGKNWEKKLINKDLDFIGYFIRDFGYIEFTNLLISKGYDGIFLDYPEWIVFNPNQIKSIWNDGSWNVNDNNIYS
jgi:hypothetical protein